jgi:O-antigen ligase
MSVRLVGAGPSVAARAPFRTKKQIAQEARATAEPTWSAEATLGVVMLLVMALLRATAKITYAPNPENSTVGVIAWTLMYGFAAIRLVQMRDRAMPMIRQSRWLAAFLALQFVSTAWSLSEMITFKDSIELIGTTMVGLYYVTRFTLREFLHIFVVTLTIIVISSIVLVFGAPARGRMDWGTGAWSGVMAEKNALGAAMAMSILTMLLMTLTAKRWVTRIFLVGILGGSILLLAGSNSVTATIVSMLTVVSLATLWGIRRKQYGIIIGGVAAVAVAAVVVFGIMGLDLDTIFQALGRSANLTGRSDLYPQLFIAMHDRPLLGFGYDSFFKTEPLVNYLADFIAVINWIPPHAHNSFYQIMLDTGALGVSIFTVVLLTSFKRAGLMLLNATRAIDLWPLAILIFLTLGSYDETYFAQNNSLEWVIFLAAALYGIRGRPVPVSSRAKRAFRPVARITR